MTKFPAARRWRAFSQSLPARRAVAIALASLAAGCGGGGAGVDPGGSALQAQVRADAAPQAQRVQLAGCVVDQHHVPHEGVPVRVLATDGRLLGSARSGRAGDFSLQVPSASHVELQVDTDQGESMPVQTQHQDLKVATCLLARGG